MNKTSNKVAILEKKNKKLKIINKFPIIKLKKGQILVKILYTSICGSQLAEIEGERGRDKFLPHGLGHEAVGKVIEIGSSVKKVKKNSKVILTWLKCRGKNVDGYSQKFNNVIYNFGPITTFSKYSILSENRCVPKPNKLNDKIASFFGCSVMTGVGVVYKHLSKIKNKNISIGLIGLGSVGFFSLLALSALKFKKIYVVEKDKKKISFAKKINFKILKTKNLKKELIKKNNNKLLDICFEASGNSKMIENAVKIIKNKGKVVICSHTDPSKKFKIHSHDLIKGKKILGSWGGGSKPDKDVSKYTKLFLSKKLKLEKVKYKLFDLNNINLAIKEYRKGKFIKPIIKCK